MKIMVSSPIILCQINGEKVETVAGFIFLGSKITADGDRSHEIRRHLLLGRKAMTNLESILKKPVTSLTMLKPLTVWITTNWTILKEMGVPDHLTCLLTNMRKSRSNS